MYMEEKRYWINRTGRRVHSPEEIADLMFLARGQRSMIADREIPSVEERITDRGHIFKYRPAQDIVLPEGSRHGDYVKEIPGELSDSERSRLVESLFNMHEKEISRLRKKSPSVSKSRKPKKKVIKKSKK